MQPRLQTIPSCESVHLLGREKHQKGVLSPVGTDDESEDGDTGDTDATGGRHRRRPSSSGSWHRQLSPCSVLSVASSGRLYAEPAQTLIFLDWDDTIFPCTELFTKRGYSRRTRDWTEPLEADLAEDLADWQEAAGEFLRAACGISDRCVILTNSKRPWVTTCINHFAPNLKPLIEQKPNLSIVYASDLMKRQKTTSDWASEKAEGLFVQSLHNFFGFFGQCAQGAQGFVTKMSESMTAMRQNAPGPPFNCTESKFKAMSVEADNFYSQYQNQTWKNIISLGDMAYEYDAVKALSATRVAPQSRERLRTKSVVLLPTPSLHGLTLQLRIWSQVLPAIARFDGDIDIDISNNFAPFQELARALQLPMLAKLQVPLTYLQPLAHWPNDHNKDFTDEITANELLDQLPILLHEAILCPPKETFHKIG